MFLGTLLEKIKSALKSQTCLHCEQSLPATGGHFCKACHEALGLRQSQAVVDSPLFVCHAAVFFNQAVKKLLYGYKFYDQEYREPQLAGLLIDYWEALQGQQRDRIHPENVLVVTIPPHRNGKSRVKRVARRFARHFGYDFQPGALAWLRDVEPQHSLNDKRARLSNVANGLTVTKTVLREHQAVIVVDDLTTTGATLREASRALRQSLAHPEPLQVQTLAIAKVPLNPRP